ncbi:MAG: cache domain-containing protein [Thermodesulfobacteriota bacterium]|nr:cache domain-containing protein [Thermodesulfobacteriota bacterium]
MKIRTKLGIFPVALSIITIALLFITLIISTNIIRSQVGKHLLTTAQSRAHDIETLLNDYKETVDILRVGIPFTNVLDPQIDYTRRMTECNLRIDRTVKINSGISRIKILDKNGIVIASSHQDIGLDLSEEAIFIKGNENAYIGEIHKSVYTGNLVISLSAPIFIRDIFSGVLIINFYMAEKLFEILSNVIGLGETGEMYLVNRDGYLITPSRFIDGAILETKIKTEQVNLFLSEHLEKGLPKYMEEKPIEYLDYNGKKVLGVHNYIPEMQWGLIAEYDVTEAYKPMSKQIVLIIIIFSVLLIVIIIVAIVVSKKIILPIKELHEGTEEIIKGNLDYKVGIELKDEIGQLSRSFDIMTERLKKEQNKLKNYTEDLESRVQERTAELKKQFEKSEKQRISNLVVLNDLNKTTKELKAEITAKKQAEQEKKKLESQLRQAQKMEAIGTLAGGIAHDFNNILFPIIGYAEMGMIGVPEDSKIRKNFIGILNASKRAGDLVQQILTFSRQHEQELKPLAAQIVVREALRLIRSSIPSTIEIDQDIEKDYNLIMADPTQIHQIVMNLCTNAYHAMEETGGSLSVNLKEMDLTPEDLTGLNMESGPYLCLTVSDTGTGMDSPTMERIFDPYFTTKEKGKGTGLGLAVVHGIVKGYGGDIRAYSEPKKGTSFHVYLPVIKTDNLASEIISDEPLQTGHEHILLIDDETQIIDMEKQMLEKLGYQVTALTSSIDALQAFKAAPDKFDLVITDMTMPNMTGDKLTGELKNIRPDIPVILCTGFSEKISKESAGALGVAGFLMKPVLMKDLARTVREAMG